MRAVFLNLAGAAGGGVFGIAARRRARRPGRTLACRGGFGLAAGLGALGADALGFGRWGDRPSPLGRAPGAAAGSAVGKQGLGRSPAAGLALLRAGAPPG